MKTLSKNTGKLLRGIPDHYRFRHNATYIRYNNMISFYPGPSRIHDEIPQYVQDAATSGILSANHRSPAFVELSKEVIGLLKAKLGVPDNYTVFFTSSATECWEIIAQSLVQSGSTHIFNGAFGQKWFDYTSRIRNAEPWSFDIEQATETKVPDHLLRDVLCLTQNETSNGTQVTDNALALIRKVNPDAIIAVDATSSIGGITLSFENADVWFGSVQKCFGLPAGLGIMICSPRAIARALEINETAHYNSITFMKKMMDSWQTSYTPNVLGIYLLMRVLKDSKKIQKVHDKLYTRYERWMDFLSRAKSIRHLVKNQSVHSFTVLPVSGDPELIKRLKSDAREKGLLLGEGYGQWKESTFRIANFPALKKDEISELMRFLKKY
ncbi:aminotransferase class V-fold PLP-dependent enzyme [Chryseolinea sp. T2]|uniref:aminotransferase class V-fold PLP-dependent enzyme n=1 Tax=Chryseolinea sp. T2 TaxID=3129255 RepID=UPI00307736AC